MNPQAMESIKPTTVINTTIILNSILEAKKVDDSVSSGLTTNLMHRRFLYSNSHSPSGLASSVTTTENNHHSKMLHKGVVLDMSTRLKMTAASINKLTETQVLHPKDFSSTIDHLRAL